MEIAVDRWAIVVLPLPQTTDMILVLAMRLLGQEQCFGPFAKREDARRLGADPALKTYGNLPLYGSTWKQ